MDKGGARLGFLITILGGVAGWAVLLFGLTRLVAAF